MLVSAAREASRLDVLTVCVVWCSFGIWRQGCRVHIKYTVYHTSLRAAADMAVHIYSLASNPNTVVHSFRTSNPCRPQSTTQQQA